MNRARIPNLAILRPVKFGDILTCTRADATGFLTPGQEYTVEEVREVGGVTEYRVLDLAHGYAGLLAWHDADCFE